MVPLPLPGGGFTFVNPNLVDDVNDVPLDLTAPVGPPLAYVSFIDERSRVVVVGTAAAIAAAIAAGSQSGGSSGEYSPNFVNFTGQVSGAASAVPWRWQRIGSIVAVWGEVLVQLNPGPGSGTFEANPPFPFAPGTSANTVANMTALPPTPAPEAPVFPYSTALNVGFTLEVTGIYPTARVLTSFGFTTTP